MQDLTTYLATRGLKPFSDITYHKLLSLNDTIYSNVILVNWRSFDHSVSRVQLRDNKGWNNLEVNPTKVQLYNIANTLDKSHIFFTESVLDAQSIIQSLSEEHRKISTAIAFGTANIYSNQLLFCKEMFRDRKIITALDNDNAGIRGTLKITESMGNSSKVLSLVYPNSDVNECLVKQPELFKNIVNNIF